METTKLSSKGQIIIPKWLRDAHQWEAGLEFMVIETGNGVLLRPSRPFDRTSLDEVAGSLPTDSPARTIEEMDEGIRRAVSERDHDRR